MDRLENVFFVPSLTFNYFFFFNELPYACETQKAISMIFKIVQDQNTWYYSTMLADSNIH